MCPEKPLKSFKEAGKSLTFKLLLPEGWKGGKSGSRRQTRGEHGSLDERRGPGRCGQKEKQLSLGQVLWLERIVFSDALDVGMKKS